MERRRSYTTLTDVALVYHPSQWRRELAYLREVAGPALAELNALPLRTRRKARRRYVCAPPKAVAQALTAELPLRPMELHLWVLRLRALGLSYRQIAALTASSKSSVARSCREGVAGIDCITLVRERRERAEAALLAPLCDEAAPLAACLSALHRHALRRGLYDQPWSEPEERLVLPIAGRGDA